MEKLKKQMRNAQAQLMQRASLLMLMGSESKVYTDFYAFDEDTQSFLFWYEDIQLTFGNKSGSPYSPYSQEQVDAAIARMDEKIEEAYKQAQHTIDVIKAWRG